MLDTLLTELAKQGVLGIFSAILIAALYFVSKALLHAKDTAIEQQQSYTEALAKSNEGTKLLLVEMKDFTSGAMVEQAKTHEGLRNALDNQKGEMKDLQGEVKKVVELKPAVENLQQEQARLVTAINQSKGS